MKTDLDSVARIFESAFIFQLQRERDQSVSYIIEDDPRLSRLSLLCDHAILSDGELEHHSI